MGALQTGVASLTPSRTIQAVPPFSITMSRPSGRNACPTGTVKVVPGTAFTMVNPGGTVTACAGPTREAIRSAANGAR